MSPANRPPGSGAYGVRHGYPIANRPRRGYGVYSYGYGIGVPYAVPLWGGWGDSGVPPYGDSSAYADQGAVAPDSPKEYAGGPPDQGQTVPPGPYVLPYQAVPPVSMRPAAPLPEEEAVTLVFSDGRAPEQIHNYALTRTTLLVMDGRRREIPLDQLDLVETAKVNREAGVEFRLVDAGR